MLGLLLRRYAPSDTYEVSRPGNKQPCLRAALPLRGHSSFCSFRTAHSALPRLCTAVLSPLHWGWQVWKCGTSLRVDGSLTGVNSKSTSLMPEWKHGHFSLLFDGAPTPSTLFFVDHVKQRYYDLTKERKASQPTIDSEVLLPLSTCFGCEAVCPLM